VEEAAQTRNSETVRNSENCASTHNQYLNELMVEFMSTSTFNQTQFFILFIHISLSGVQNFVLLPAVHAERL
jgi:hypothetical protein